MGQNDLHASLLQRPDAVDGRFRPGPVGVDAAHVLVRVHPLPNLPLLADDAAIVAGVARKVYPALAAVATLCAGEEVDVAREVPGSVNYIQASVLEEIQGRGEVAQWFPWPGEVNTRLGIFVAFGTWAWELNSSRGV